MLSGLSPYDSRSPDMPPSTLRWMARRSGPTVRTKVKTTGSATPARAFLNWTRNVALRVDPISASPTGTRSCPYVAISSGPACPRAAIASFQARLYASWTPVFMPCPEAGLCTWAASPATKQRPSCMRGTMRCWKVKTEVHSGSPTRTARPSPALSFCENRRAGSATARCSPGAVSSSRQYPSRWYGTIIRAWLPVWTQ